VVKHERLAHIVVIALEAITKVRCVWGKKRAESYSEVYRRGVGHIPIREKGG